MAIFRSFSDVVISMLEYLRLVQGDLDSKPGTVARDVFVDAPAARIAELYSELRNISGLQSFFSTNGTDLNKLASNFGVTRGVGAYSSGIAVFTTNSLSIDILIPESSFVSSRNGITFKTTSSTLMSSSNANVYRANATRLRTDLDLAGITDEFAVEVNVQSTISGSSGNVGRFMLNTHQISGISNVTNLESFSGGTDQESDSEFRSRILSVFAGSNTGTALGYNTTLSTISGVDDSVIVVPGDPLLIRDGTQTALDSNGNLIVSEPGTGGKVDIYILGSQLESQVDSFIYNDQSGLNDPTNPSNDYVIGQGGEDTTLDAAQRRVTLINEDNLPQQPVDSITSVVGSSSGSNFIEKYTDSDGQVKGNYELIKDTGDFGGSPFGFDKLRWTSNQIELTGESVTKGIFNGSDELEFADINEASAIYQDYLIFNENAVTNNSDRSILTLQHTPIKDVSRIVNLTTGERYVVENRNPDGEADALNTTGRVKISGSTLPVSTDVLQVDYTWVKSFDKFFDFDNLKDININRSVQDSVDWSFSNLVVNEPSEVVDDGYGNLTVSVTHSVFKIVSINTFEYDVSSVSSGIVSANQEISNIIDIRRVSDGAELYNTDSADGSLSGSNYIILPTDSLAEDGDIVSIRFNATNIMSSDGYSDATFDDNIIALPAGVSANGTSVLVNYIADVNTLIPEINISALPAVGQGNSFLISNTLTGEQPTSNLISGTSYTKNLRKAPSNIMVMLDSIGSRGTITVSGITTKKISNALVVATSGNGYELDLSSAIRTDLGLSYIPSTVKVIKLEGFERVNINSSNKVSSIDNVYDIVNYKIKDNSYDLDAALKDTSLSYTKVVIPQTTGNKSARLNTGDIVRVTFYYVNTSGSESLYFSRNGTHVTNKVFQYVNRISVGHGFTNVAGDVIGKIVVKNFNQPINNTSYSVDYNYVAPKENERITITYNHNKIVNTATLAIEDVRPITADVLIKLAKAKEIDISLKIVLLPEYLPQSDVVEENAINTVTTFLNANSLGTTIDASDVINALYSVSGVDRVQIINFSTGSGGNVLSIAAEKNEYLKAGTVDITIEER